MGAGPSVSPATVAPAGKPEKAEKLDKADSNKVTSGNPGAPAQRNSTALRANEALIFNYIRKKVTRRTPDVPLLDILKESRACNNFMRYIRESLVTDLVTHGMDPKLAETAKETAYNYLQFWLDTSDFTLFSASSFRNFRAEKICERYLAHGSRNLLPFSRLMVDEILLRRDAESTVPEDLFTPAQNEAYEFLEAEVLPCYLTCEGPSGYRMVKKLTSVIDRLRRSTSGTRGTRGSAKLRQTSAEVLNEMHSKLAVVLWDPLATRAFKDFLSTLGGAELLIFYLEVTDFKEMFTAVLSQAAPPRKDGAANTAERDLVSRDFHYFLTRSHKIYDKYLKLGSPLRELFTDKELEDLVRRASSLSDLNPCLFDELKDKVFEHMLVEHFSEFQKSEQNANYQKMVQARSEKRKKSLEYIRNRRKMLDVAKSVNLGGFLSPKPKLEKRSSSGEGLGESQKEPTGAGSGTPVSSPNPGCRPSVGKDRVSNNLSNSLPKSNGTPNSTNPNVGKELDEADFETLLAEEAQELLQMLDSNASSRFQQYLLEQQEAHKLLFWFEIEDYKAIPHTQTVFVQGRAQKVFDKYVKRGAPLELMLDTSVRNAIVASIDKAHLRLFDAAQQTIFDSLLQEEWPLFKQHELFGEYQREKEDRKRSSAQYSAAATSPVVDVSFSEILNFPILCSSFKKFVETEFCVEPLMFWLEVEEYKRLPRSQYMQNRCRKIVNRYIRNGAPMAISITAEARAQAYERIKDPGPLCFQMAELEVYNFMENCLLPKFRKSAEYQELLRSIETERKAAALTPAVKPELEMDVPMSPGSGAEGPLTLKTLLASQNGVKFFKEFCESRHCEENLLFWLEAEDFKDIPGKDFLKIRARKIVNKYINEDSKQQVNIPSSIRLDLLKNLEHPGRSLFQKAQIEIFKLMQKDSYPPFLQSEQYKAYQDLLQGTQETNWSAILRRRSMVLSKDTHRTNSYEKSQT